MLTLRLKRVGRRHDPSFRVVAVDSRTGPKSGKHVEQLGSYNPRSDERTLNAERIQYWLGHGAQVSGTLHNLLISEGIVKGEKVNVLPQKSPVKKETEQADTPAAAPAATAEAETATETSAPDEVNDAAEENAAEAPEDQTTEGATPSTEPKQGTEAEDEKDAPSTEEPSSEAAGEPAPEAKKEEAEK